MYVDVVELAETEFKRDLVDASGQKGIPLVTKMLAVLRVLGRGTCFDGTEDWHLVIRRRIDCVHVKWDQCAAGGAPSCSWTVKCLNHTYIHYFSVSGCCLDAVHCTYRENHCFSHYLS